MSSYLEDFMEKLSLTSIDVNRYMRHIRMLDQRIEDMKPSLETKQREFAERVKLFRERKVDQKALDGELEDIQKMEKLIYGMALQKIKVSEQLQQAVSETLQKIDSQLTRLRADQKKNGNGVEEEREDRGETCLKKKKHKQMFKQIQKLERADKQWLYDRSQPKYCYCGVGSHGQMVECQQPYCQREWFHRGCVADKTLPEHWICNECKKLKDKLKNTSIKWFLS